MEELLFILILAHISSAVRTAVNRVASWETLRRRRIRPVQEMPCLPACACMKPREPNRLFLRIIHADIVTCRCVPCKKPTHLPKVNPSSRSNNSDNYHISAFHLPTKQVTVPCLCLHRYTQAIPCSIPAVSTETARRPAALPANVPLGPACGRGEGYS
jgi:hypothetical protein